MSNDDPSTIRLTGPRFLILQIGVKRPARPGLAVVTNHTQVLLRIARDPEIRLRDIADEVGTTLRSAQRIPADLAEVGYAKRQRHVRRNRYVINPDAAMLRHTVQNGHSIGELLNLLRLEDHVLELPERAVGADGANAPRFTTALDSQRRPRASHNARGARLRDLLRRPNRRQRRSAVLAFNPNLLSTAGHRRSF